MLLYANIVFNYIHIYIKLVDFLNFIIREL